MSGGVTEIGSDPLPAETLDAKLCCGCGEPARGAAWPAQTCIRSASQALIACPCLRATANVCKLAASGTCSGRTSSEDVRGSLAGCASSRVSPASGSGACDASTAASWPSAVAAAAAAAAPRSAASGARFAVASVEGVSCSHLQCFRAGQGQFTAEGMSQPSESCT